MHVKEVSFPPFRRVKLYIFFMFILTNISCWVPKRMSKRHCFEGLFFKIKKSQPNTMSQQPKQCCFDVLNPKKEPQTNPRQKKNSTGIGILKKLYKNRKRNL